MDWRRRKQIALLVDGILECNVLNRPPIELIREIMKKRDIKFEERNEEDDEFCGVYIVIGNTKIIFVNSNLYETRKNFTIAHELGHHFLGHTLTNGAIICDKSALDAKNKGRPEREKEADYFAGCFLMPEKLIFQKKKEFEENRAQQMGLFTPIGVHENNHELIEYLCGFFKVSKEAMTIRLNELKLE